MLPSGCVIIYLSVYLYADGTYAMTELIHVMMNVIINLIMVVNWIKQDICISLYYISALLLYEVIFNANKQLRHVETFQPWILVAIVLPSLFRTWITFSLLSNSRRFHKYIRDHTFMTFTQEGVLGRWCWKGWGRKECWKFVTCLQILVTLKTTMLDKIFGAKCRNPVKLDRTRKVWYLFSHFLWLLPKFYLWRGDWTLGYDSLFPKILSLKLFGISWGNWYTKFAILDMTFRFTCG